MGDLGSIHPPCAYPSTHRYKSMCRLHARVTPGKSRRRCAALGVRGVGQAKACRPTLRAPLWARATSHPSQGPVSLTRTSPHLWQRHRRASSSHSSLQSCWRPDSRHCSVRSSPAASTAYVGVWAARWPGGDLSKRMNMRLAKRRFGCGDDRTCTPQLLFFSPAALPAIGVAPSDASPSGMSYVQSSRNSPRETAIATDVMRT